jgi:hypothetical protein
MSGDQQQLISLVWDTHRIIDRQQRMTERLIGLLALEHRALAALSVSVPAAGRGPVPVPRPQTEGTVQ